jgi:hypothetical protein
MLSLDSDRWRELSHAYGAADDIPALLRQLHSVPSSANNAEPWTSLWSTLVHQGDVYSATFASVPHVIEAIASMPAKADFAYFQFPAWVEICRAKKNVAIPADLRPAYNDALARLPELVARASAPAWSDDLLACSLAAIAAAKGQPSMAEAILELTPEVSEQFLLWLSAQ